MIARAFLAVAFLCLFTGTSCLPLINPSDKVCQSLSTSCEDLWVASSCKVVKSCITEVWEKLDVPLDKSNVCNICKEMVKEARDQLMSNETQEELKEVLEGSCKLIPITVFADMCIKMVDEFIPDLIDILVSRMDPDQVCTIAGLCNMNFFTQMRTQQDLLFSAFQSRIFLPPVANSLPPRVEECPRCLKTLKPLRAIIRLLPEAQVELLALKMCQDHHKDSLSECPYIVKKYVSPIYDYLYETGVNQICVDIRRCPASDTVKATVPLVKAGDDFTCDFCKQLVGNLRNYLEANTTEDELKQALLAFCEDLGAAAEECQNLVDEYFDMVYAFLLEATEPERFCSTIGLCPSSLVRVPLVKMFPSLPAAKVHLQKPKYPKKTNGTTLSKVTPLVKLMPGIPAKYVNKDVPKKDVGEGPECEICLYIVKYLEAAIEDKKNQDAIKHALDEACKLLPSHARGRCVKLVDEYLDAIVQIIVNDGDPSTICGLLGPCASQSRVKSHAALEAEKSLQGGVECEICKAVIDFLENNLPEGVTADIVEYVLDELCGRLDGQKAQECRNFVNKNIDLILKYLSGDVAAAAVCHIAGLCAVREDPVPHVTLVSDSPDCVLCKEIIQVIYNELKDVRTEEAIRKQLDRVCTLVPSSSRQTCVNIVNTYFEALVSLLLQDLTPDEVCASLQFCLAPQKTPALPMPQNGSVAEGPACQLCETVVQTVYNELKDTRTEEAIKQELDRVCSLLPSSSQQECVNLINTYFDLLVSLILQDFTPEEVCTALKLCSPSGEAVAEPKSQKSSESDDPVCTLCKDVVQFVYAELKDNRTEQEIKQALDEVCNWVPTSSKAECLNMISTYYDLLVSLILQDFTPEQICQTLGLCPSTSHGDVVCTFCQYALHFIQNELMDPNTEEAIKEALDRLCSSLPDELSKECQAFVDEYGTSVVVLLAQELDPSIVCVAVRACPKGGLIKQSMALQNLHLDKCDTCSLVIDYLERLTRDAKTDAELASVFEGVCNAVPAGIKGECQSLVKAYGPFILHNIGQLGNSRQVCQAMDICPKSAKGVHLLGSKKCTFGPAYWCHSEAHASACNAHQYCKKKVWKQ